MTKIELARQHRNEAEASLIECERAAQRCQQELSRSITQEGCEAIHRFLQTCQEGIELAKLECELYDEYIAKYRG